jgi:hypothetical protein
MTHLRDARNFSSAARRDTGTDTGKVRDAADTLTQTNADEWRLPRLSREGGHLPRLRRKLKEVAGRLPPRCPPICNPALRAGSQSQRKFEICGRSGIAAAGTG